MNRISVGQLVPTIANVGVIASIVFLAIQVEQNSDIQRAQARAIRAQIRIDSASARTDNPAMLTAFLKQRRGEPLTQMEELLLEVDARVVLVGWQYIYGEFREGLIEDVDVPIEDWRLAFSRTPSFDRVWQQSKNVSFRPDFVAWMEENVVSAVPVPALPVTPNASAPLESAIPSQ